VLEVVDKTEAIMQDADLKGDSAALHGRLEAAFEEAMGPVLDELLADLDLKVRNAGLAIKELVKKYNAGNLTQQELLEVRLIQLTLALFEGALDEAPAESGLMEQLRGVLEQAGVPLVDQEDIIEKARTATPANMDEILSKLPEQDREAARKALTEQARQAP